MAEVDRRPGEGWISYCLRKDGRAGESPGATAGRLHDERHGTACRCAWARAGRIHMPVPGVVMDTVPAGKRLAVRRG